MIVWLPFFFLFFWSGVGAEAVRAVWVVRHEMTSQERISEVVQQASRAGLNTLFVQVRGRGDAYYESDLAPPGEGIEPGLDPLAYCVERARDAGLQVHAWVNVYLTWYPDREAPEDHLLRTNPDWFMISSDGIDLGQPGLTDDIVKRGVEGRYLSPAHPSVSPYLLEVIGEIIDRYRVDGIHLDYVRYPNEHYDYSPLARTGFWADTDTDPPTVGGAEEAVKTWNRWRSARVTEFVREAKALLLRRNPALVLSAAVKPDLETAYTRYGQNWIDWVNRRYLDVVVPMFYTGSNRRLLERMRLVRKYVQKGRVVAGIGAWNQDTVDTVKQIEGARDARLAGFSLFSYETLKSVPSLQSAMAEEASR